MKTTSTYIARLAVFAAASLVAASVPHVALADEAKPIAPAVYNIQAPSFGGQCVVSTDDRRLGLGSCSGDNAYWVIGGGTIMNSNKIGLCRNAGGYLVVDKSTGALVYPGGCSTPNSQWGASRRQPSGWLIYNTVVVVNGAPNPVLTYANYSVYGPSFYLAAANNQYWGSQTWSLKQVK